LSLRWHECPCGVSAQRDLYSAHLARFVYQAEDARYLLDAGQAQQAWPGAGCGETEPRPSGAGCREPEARPYGSDGRRPGLSRAWMDASGEAEPLLRAASEQAKSHNEPVRGPVPPHSGGGRSAAASAPTLCARTERVARAKGACAVPVRGGEGPRAPRGRNPPLRPVLQAEASSRTPRGARESEGPRGPEGWTRADPGPGEPGRGRSDASQNPPALAVGRSP